MFWLSDFDTMFFALTAINNVVNFSDDGLGVVFFGRPDAHTDGGHKHWREKSID